MPLNQAVSRVLGHSVNGGHEPSIDEEELKPLTASSDSERAHTPKTSSMRWSRSSLLLVVLTMTVLPLLILTDSRTNMLRPVSDTPSQPQSQSSMDDTSSTLPSIIYTVTNHSVLPHSSPADSTAHYIAIIGHYSDGSQTKYELCTYTRACHSAYNVYFTLSDYTQYHYHSLLFPSCHEWVLRESHTICKCFHEYYQALLMPFPHAVSDDERQRVAVIVRERFLVINGMTEVLFAAMLGRVRNASAMKPSVSDLQNMSFTVVDESGDDSKHHADHQHAHAHTHTNSTRLYTDPFTNTPSPLRTASQNISNRTDTSLTIVRIHGHRWSLNKWVEHHHIAHWAQKLLVMQATYGHWANLCTRQFQSARVADNVIQHREHDNPIYYRLHQCDSASASDNDPLWCMPPLTGMLFHDTAAPITNHMENILNITSISLQQWIHNANVQLTQRQQHCAKRNGVIAPAAVKLPVVESVPARAWKWTQSLLSPPLVEPSSSPPQSSIIDSPLSSIDTFAVSGNVLWWQHLYQQWPQHVIDDRMVQNRNLPPYQNIHELHCIDRVTMSPIYGILAESAYDTAIWRKSAQQWYEIRRRRGRSVREIVNMPTIVPQTLLRSSGDTMHDAISGASHWNQCPPSRAILVTRPDRAIINIAELTAMLLAKYNLQLSVLSIDASTSSDDQAKLFGESGLVMASHSSQLINVLFAPVNSAMIEITGEFYNLDFARYATSMGIYFRYALGTSHFEGGREHDALMDDCMTLLAKCDGDSSCIKDNEWWGCKQGRHYPNKNKAFNASLAAVDRAVMQALHHLVSVCNGKWNSVKLAKVTETG